MLTDHFSGPGRAISPCVCLSVCPNTLLNKMTYDLDTWHAGSS